MIPTLSHCVPINNHQSVFLRWLISPSSCFSLSEYVFIWNSWLHHTETDLWPRCLYLRIIADSPISSLMCVSRSWRKPCRNGTWTSSETSLLVCCRDATSALTSHHRKCRIISIIILVNFKFSIFTDASMCAIHVYNAATLIKPLWIQHWFIQDSPDTNCLNWCFLSSNHFDGTLTWNRKGGIVLAQEAKAWKRDWQDADLQLVTQCIAAVNNSVSTRLLAVQIRRQQSLLPFYGCSCCL